MNNTAYLSCADTAKLIRQALKESFPGVKFGVRSSTYSMGASIRVTWTDGPNSEQVRAVSGKFAGAYFDGMTDYKGSKYHTLDGKPVHFLADFVFEEREHSDVAVARAIAAVVRHYGGCSAISVEDYRQGRAWNWQNTGGCDLGRALSQALAKHSDRLAASPSATLGRVRFTGDDGYGYGTVGRNFEGGDQCAKAQSEALARQRVGGTFGTL
jgi:hypothetical protein